MNDMRALEAYKNAPCHEKLAMIRLEMSTPIESIRGLARIAGDSNDNSEIQTYLQRIQQEADDLKRILETLIE